MRNNLACSTELCIFVSNFREGYPESNPAFSDSRYGGDPIPLMQSEPPGHRFNNVSKVAIYICKYIRSFETTRHRLRHSLRVL